jgi:hypothetical protein
MALITNRNSPNVTIVRGNVSMIRIGLTIALTIPKIIAAIAAVAKLPIVIPGTI